MSVLIKAQTGGPVRRFGASAEPEPKQVASPAEPAEDPRLLLLAEENAELRSALADLQIAAERAKAAAREEGKKEAEAAIRTDEAKRLGAVQAALAGAQNVLDERLEALEGLAALLSRSAIAMLFDQASGYSELVCAMLARQMERVRRDAVLGIRVSREDFADEAALAAAAQGAGTGSISIGADPDLRAGECRIDLQLGHIDIGPAAQWPQLSRLLDELAVEDLRP